MDAQHLFTQLAEAVADGREPDWGSADVSALSDTHRALIAQLKAVSEISRCLASATVSTGLSSIAALESQPPADGAVIGRDIPAVWGTLRIRERVGRGRFGDVYRAWDPAIHRDVALKLLRRQHSDADPSDSVVVQEGRFMARVRHPNVATIYGAAHVDGRTGLWMEFIEGRTLEAELRDRGPFDAAEVATLGIELCRALGAVHSAGVVHRDVKAQNIMREVTGRVVLGDFGTGLEAEEAEGAVALAGTPLYLAPEIFRLAPATPQSDLYSLGVVLFHLATGSYPVKGRTIADVKLAHANGTRRSVRDIRPEIPEAFAAVIERAVEPDPARRCQTASDLERALAAAIAPVAPTAPDAAPDGAAQPAATSTRTFVRSHPLLAAASVFAAVASLIAITPFGSYLVGLSTPAPGGRNLLATTETQNRRLSKVPAPAAYQFLGRPSPDGRWYTFTDMNGDLSVFDTDSGDVRRLTDQSATGGTAYVTAPFSYDSTQIAYSWQTRDQDWELRAIGVDGRSSRVVLRSAKEIVHPLQWSQDGRQILVTVERPDHARALALVSALDGRTVRLAAVDAGFTIASLAPDGRQVVFDNGQHQGEVMRDIFITSTDSPGDARPLIKGAGDDFRPQWTRDGDQVLFMSDRTGEPSLWAVAVSDGVATGAPMVLQRNIGRARPTGLTADGTLYYELTVGLVDVFVATLASGYASVAEGPQAVAPLQVGSSITSSWSRDGRRVAYVSLPFGEAASSVRRIRILDVDTGVARTLSPALSYYQFPRWSPDGRTLLVKGSDSQSRNGLFLVDAETGAARAAALAGGTTPAEIGAMQWGPDDHTILFTRAKVGLVSLDLGSGAERTLFDFASEGITAIQPNPGFRLSPDGRSIVYAASRKTSTGGNETVLRVKEFGRPARDLVVGPVGVGDWTPDGLEVLFTRAVPKDNTRALWILPMAGGEPRPVGLEMVGLRDVSLNPDGRRITLTSGFPSTELWRLEGFLLPHQ